MANILALTADLPYFPGKNGHDFFNFRHLAQTHRVGIVGPCYDRYPKDGIANLERFLQGAYFWPRPAPEVPLFGAQELPGRLTPLLTRLPGLVRWLLLRRLLNIQHRPRDAFGLLSVLANCAPQLVHALSQSHWHAMVLIQTSVEPWLDYLPATGGKLVYFHDVRSDYLRRSVPIPGQRKWTRWAVAAVRRQEQRVTERADVAGFVSDLDHQRARGMFRMRAEAGVAPIPLDTGYFTPRPPQWRRDPRPLVLFTGHLTHPPNVDAVLFFLREIWPRILERSPQAVFQAVGMLPAPELERAIGDAPGCELHANVPDIRPFFWNASAYVVPMRFGGGVRQKLFEAWSMRVPVVCTTMAAEGTGAAHGAHCWLEDAPAAFAERVASLLEDPDSAAVVARAKDHVEASNSIAAAAPRFQELVERAISIKKRRPFKLLYDLRWMALGIAGGIEQATYELVSAIGRIDRRNGYRIFAPRSACCEWDFPPGFQVGLHYSDSPERRAASLRALVANRLAESLGRARVLTPAMRSLAAYNRLDFDLVHSASGYIHPDLLGFPGILTINDLQHLRYPEFFSPQEYAEREQLYRESAARARHIICISEFTRQDVHRRYGIPLEKMTTVWIIPSRNVWREVPAARRQDLLSAMGLSGPFLFFPAHCWPHKNHARLVEAFSLVAAELPKDLKLVLTGRPFPADHPAGLQIAEKKLGTRIVHLGYRSPLEMRALFQGCLALVFPSLFEGYGMPVAEAIIAGKPVACSNVTSLPEIAGEAAVTFDPNSVEDIAARLMEVATRPELRAALAAAAIRRRPRFSARRTAIATLAIYQAVYDELYGA